MNATSRYVRWTYIKVAQNVTIEYVFITSGTSGPTITVIPATLSGFKYISGFGPSTQQSFSLSETNLSANVVITAPVSFSISTTSGLCYTNSISLPFSSGTLANTTIYIILNFGLALNRYTGNCTATNLNTAT